MLKVVEEQAEREASEGLLPLDEIAREGARRMLIEALRAEADDYVERYRGGTRPTGTRAGGAQRPRPGAQAYPGSGDRSAQGTAG